ncbi:MAG: HDIG domain-containing protein [Deltaproteobacteria bacterium]|nr:HDIG domain-containing protein [Deltaproteobacteria bacterium]
MIPTKEQCLELIGRHKMLPHIVRHSQLVTRVAVLIARKLNGVGQQLDLALVEAGALLHDITKTISIETSENHAQTGGELLTSLGYPGVAEIVRQHICLDPGSFDPDAVTEAEVVNYADKRVKHEEVVDIEDRFQDVLERYVKKIPRYVKKIPGLEARFEQVQRETQLVEQKIFSKIDISPEQIRETLDNPQT